MVSHKPAFSVFTREPGRTLKVGNKSYAAVIDIIFHCNQHIFPSSLYIAKLIGKLYKKPKAREACQVPFLMGQDYRNQSSQFAYCSDLNVIVLFGHKKRIFAC
jgi:hypothetical protein